MHGAVASEAGKGHEVVRPLRLATPIVLNSPHSGRDYPADFLAASRLDALALRRSEDAFVDELFSPGVALGAPLLRALFPRAYIDVNREPYELDPQMYSDSLPPFANTRSLRVAGGLGTVPRVVGDAQPIYRGPLASAEALARVERLYRPYHAELTGLIDDAAAAFGVAILVDCHSMPSSAVESGQADFVVGDRFGASAAPWVSDAVVGALQALGYVVRRNKPYAGGFITEHYGAPAYQRHAVQIEINRALYLDERRIEKLPAAGEHAQNIFKVIEALAARYVSFSRLNVLAAE